MFEINICCYKCLKAKKSLKAKNVPGQKSKSQKVQKFTILQWGFPHFSSQKSINRTSFVS